MILHEESMENLEDPISRSKACLFAAYLPLWATDMSEQRSKTQLPSTRPFYTVNPAYLPFTFAYCQMRRFVWLS